MSLAQSWMSPRQGLFVLPGPYMSLCLFSVHSAKLVLTDGQSVGFESAEFFFFFLPFLFTVTIVLAQSLFWVPVPLLCSTIAA